MSWSLTFNGTPQELPQELPAQSRVAVEAANTGSGDAAFMAYQLALNGVLSGRWGTGEKRFDIRLTGHHNPGCEPVPGYPNDFVSIQVVQQ